MRKKYKIDLVVPEGAYEIKMQEQGDELLQQTKNMGGGAVIGAAVAGPIGAALGTYIGSKLKECPCIIYIPEQNIRLKAFAPIGFLKEQANLKFFEDDE